jgi:hypothetical protein
MSEESPAMEEYLRLTTLDSPKVGLCEIQEGTWRPCTLLNFDWPMVRVRCDETTFWTNMMHVRVMENT